MKQGAKNLQQINIGVNLDTVEEIHFKFQQGKVTRLVDYPSDLVRRMPGSDNALFVEWSPEDSFLFDPDYEIGLDAMIKPVNSEYHLCTKPTRFWMMETLFTREEVLGNASRS